MALPEKEGKQEPSQEIAISDFKVGDKDPTTGKKIIYIAYQTNTFIITIDSAINLNWYADSEMQYAKDFGEVASRVSLTEALVDRIFLGKANRIAYKKMLADVLARVMDECDSKTAKQILEETTRRVEEHSKERVRMAYISYAVLSVVIVGVLVILALIWRKPLARAIDHQDIFRVIICTLLGGIGAFITTFFRFRNYEGSIVAGLPIHRLDGFLRVFYGLIAGIIISLAIKGKILAGFAADAEQPWILYFFAMVAGASEVLIPNLIKQAESQTSLKNGTKKEEGNNKASEGEDELANEEVTVKKDAKKNETGEEPDNKKAGDTKQAANAEKKNTEDVAKKNEGTNGAVADARIESNNTA